MATLASARDKMARKAPAMQANYNAAKGRMNANYAPGMSRFLGAQVAGHIVTSYQAGIAQAQIRVDPDKWARNLVAKMTGGGGGG